MCRSREAGRRPVLDLAAGACMTVDPRRGASDHLHGALGPAVERILLDHDPLLRVLAFDLFLCADQSRHVEIASSIFGYAPQRQRLPDMAWRISSRLGAGVSPTSAEAETIWPGVQNPHWSASARTKESTSGWSRSPSMVVTSRAPTACVSVMHEAPACRREDGARAAMPFSAGDLRAREPEVVAERLGKRLQDGAVDRVAAAVDDQLRQRPPSA